MYKVYKYTNLLNGKIYIGQTCSSLEKRAGHNGYKYKKCIYFYNAIKKYGWNNFRGEILLDNLTREEANLMEIKLISFYNSNNKSIGYNISDGGNTNSVRRRSVYQYDLEGNYIQKFISATEAENKLTDYFDGYDYIFGDWSYGKLRLKGFMEEKKSNKINNIKFIDDYIKKYCSYECKYFLLKKVNKE